MTTIPTYTQLYNDVLADIEAQFGVTIPTFGKNFLRVLAAVQAAKLKFYYYAIARLQKNLLPDTADSEAIGGTLERFGRIKLGRNPFPATAGQYTVQVTGTIGATIPAATTFKSDDDAANPGKLYILDAAYTLVAITDTITVRAIDAGIDSKLAISDTISATQPIAGVDKQATVTVEAVQPLAAESTAQYRAAIIDAFQLEAQGGAASDYRIWASDAQGVQKVYPYARSGASGEINVYVEATVADSTDGFGTPSSTILTDVESVIEFDPDTSKPLNDRGRRPLTAKQVHVLAITPRTIDISITGFVDYTADKETAINAALQTEIGRIRPFISGADVLENKNNVLDTNKVISIILSAVPGSIFGGVTISIDGATASSFTFSNGDIPNYNSLTFI